MSRMAKTREKYRKELERFDLFISAESKEHFRQLAKQYDVTQREMLESMISLFDLNGAEEARRLMAEHNGDDTAARAAYIAELAIEFPGQIHNKVGTLANRKFSPVNSAIGKEKKKIDAI